MNLPVRVFIFLFIPAVALTAKPDGPVKLRSIYAKDKALSSWDKSAPFIATKDIPEPYWIKKPRVVKKMFDSRYIPVSVEVLEPTKAKGKKTLKMQAGAIINVPLKETMRFASNLKNYTRAKPYVEKIEIYDSEKLMYAKTQAYDYYAEFLVQHMQATMPEKQAQLQWRIVGGLFKGMTVVYDFKDVGNRKTQIAMSALYKFKKMPLPKLFIEFGLEVIMQRAGAKLRALAEDDFKNPKPIFQKK